MRVYIKHKRKVYMQIKTKLKGLNVRGASHHLLLPIIAVLIVAGIGGFIMQRNSSAATVCRNATYYKGSRSECVRYAQYMLGVKADAAFGPGTQKKLKSVTGQTALNKTAWNKLCGKNYSAFVTKQRNAACIGGAYVTKIGNPTIGRKVPGSKCGLKKVWATNGKCVEVGKWCRTYSSPKDAYDWYSWSAKGTCSVGHYK